MELCDFLVDARRLWLGEAAWPSPLALVDLDATPDVPADIALPPCPVIGLGDRSHALAGRLDAVIEKPVGAQALARNILLNPNAAAVSVQLLRLLPGMSATDGLVAESMAYGLLQGSEEHHRWLAGRPDASLRAAGRVDLRRDKGGLTVTLASPGCGNAIDRAMRDALREAMTLAALDPEIEQASLRAEGRTFCLGAELGEFGTTRDPASAHAIRALTLPAHVAARIADKLHVHVQGGCVGAGLELAAWAKRFTASADAWFQLPELAMGLLPGAGGCVSLTRRIGRQRTALLLLSGKRISASVALDWGLVDAIVDQPTPDDGGAYVA